MNHSRSEAELGKLTKKTQNNGKLNLWGMVGPYHLPRKTQKLVGPYHY
jgi:hypothetical protein